MEKCRRRWDLAEDEELKFKFMMAYDRAFNHLDKVGVLCIWTAQTILG